MGGSGGKTRKGPADKRIFVSNLPYEMKWQEVKDLFRQEVGEVSYVELFNDESGKPRGAGVMEFPTQEMAKLAIDKMHRFDYKGRKIVVKEDFDAERDKFGRIIGRSGGGGGDRGGRDDRRGGHGDMGGGGHHGGHGGGGHGVDMGNTYGLSPQFLASLNIMVKFNFNRPFASPTHFTFCPLRAHCTRGSLLPTWTTRWTRES